MKKTPTPLEAAKRQAKKFKKLAQQHKREVTHLQADVNRLLIEIQKRGRRIDELLKANEAVAEASKAPNDTSNMGPFASALAKTDRDCEYLLERVEALRRERDAITVDFLAESSENARKGVVMHSMSRELKAYRIAVLVIFVAGTAALISGVL